MNSYFILIALIIIGNYLLTIFVDILNLSHITTDLPDEFKNYYNAEEYKKSQNYLRETTCFALIIDTFFTLITISFIISGGFNIVDNIARSLGFNDIGSGLIFTGLLLFASGILHIPFSAYETFVIEEKYGFNRTSLKTFLLDILKGCLLAAAIGGPLFALILWFFETAGQWAWLYCWGAVTLFQIFLTFIAPVVIMPLFNKFVPLEEGDLKAAIQQYARSRSFKMQGIFTMDGSMRSAKSNAFFTGLGRFKRVVLFDTLIQKHTVEELVAILAHEIGHYKKKHIIITLILSAVTSAMLFFILSLFLNNPDLFEAFQMERVSIYASLVFFGFLYTPIEMILSVAGCIISRRNEYEADQYAVDTYGQPEAMISALKKLSVDNLSNLVPHPLKVFLTYSHPPVLDRIRHIRGIKKSEKPV